MRASVQVVHDMVAAVRAHDPLEAEQRSDVLSWLSATDDVFRREKPATPDKHLVSYVCLVDPADGSVLLVDHINARLWLPPGGHVEPDEHPAVCAEREVQEELGVNRYSGRLADEPSFVTCTTTVGIDSGHTDVSLWFVMEASRATALTADQGEFHEARWWSPREVRATASSTFDPHFQRFLEKITSAT